MKGVREKSPFCKGDAENEIKKTNKLDQMKGKRRRRIQFEGEEKKRGEMSQKNE